MYRELGSKHNVPHIHTEYSGEEVVIPLDGDILEGSIPKNKQKLVDSLIEIHLEDLIANWKLLSEGQ